MSTETTTTEINEAKLFWDDADHNWAGWWLRYRDSTGQEQGTEIDGDEDATTAELAAACAAALPGSAGDIRVIRGGERRGRITLRGDEAPDWRAL